MTKRDVVLYIIQNALMLVGRNECGNKLTLRTSQEVHEDILREVERVVFRELNQRVTVFWEKTKAGTDPTYAELNLDFDAKLPYDRYPLQKLLEWRLNK